MAKVEKTENTTGMDEGNWSSRIQLVAAQRGAVALKNYLALSTKTKYIHPL